MKKRILSFILTAALVCLLYPAVPLPAAAWESGDQDVIDSLNDVLCGISESDVKGDVSQWTDNELYSILENKLFYSRDLNLQPVEGSDKNNMYSSYNLADIQALTQECFGRDFPKNHASVTNGQVDFILVRNEGSRLFVQNYCIRGNTLTAVGLIISWGGNGNWFSGYFQATFQVNPSCRYGYTLTSVKELYQGKTFGNLKATASSELKESSVTHRAERVLDGNLTTAWVEGVSGSGINEWLKIYTSDGSKMEFLAVGIWLGYHKTQELMEKNNTPTMLLIETEDGLHQKAYCDMAYYIGDEVVIALDRPVHTSWIKFTILDTFSGTHYDDTCISDIELIGVDSDRIFSQLPDAPQDSEVPSSPSYEQPEQNNSSGSIPQQSIDSEAVPNGAQGGSILSFFDSAYGGASQTDGKQDSETPFGFGLSDGYTNIISTGALIWAGVSVAVLVGLLLFFVRKKKQ